MKGLLKIVFGTVAALVLIFALLTVVVLMVFDPDDYQQLMTDAVFEQTGRVLEIDGGISIDTLPCCGVEVEDARLGNPEGFPDDNFAQVQSVRLGLQLWPLLVDQEIIIGDIALEGLNLTLVRGEDGVANWDFSVGESSAPTEPESTETMASLPLLTAAGIQIIDARVTYRDEMTGAHYRVEDFDLQTGTINLGQPIDVDIAIQATDVASNLTVQGDLSMAVDANLDTMQVSVLQMSADVEVSGDELPTDRIALSVQTASIDVDLDTMQVSVSQVNADVAVSGAELPGEQIALSAQTEGVNFDVESGNLVIRNQRVSVLAAGATVKLTADGTISDGSPDLAGTFSLEPVSPRELLRALKVPDIETSDPEALSNLQATANWSLGKELAGFKKLRLRLDDTNIKGRAQINYLDQSGLTFKFVGDQLAIDRYLEPEKEAAPQKAAKPSGPTEVPVETVQGLDFSGQVRLDRLTMDALLLENLNAKIVASKGRVRLAPMTADLYGGRYKGAVTINVKRDPPVVNFKQSVAKVDAAGLLTDLAEVSNLEGTLEASFTGKGKGRTDAEIIKTLAGELTFDLDDGVYKGVDVWHEIRKARAIIKQEPAPPKSAEPQTPIEVMTLNGNIKKGVLKTTTLVVQIPFLRMKGNGALNMAAENLDFKFRAEVHEKPVFSDGEDLASLQGIMIPLTVTGAVASPSVGVDLAELAKSEAVRKAEDLLLDKLGLTDSDEAGEGGEESKPDDARDVLKKGLRDLFDR
jgi:AsmA protein